MQSDSKDFITGSRTSINNNKDINADSEHAKDGDITSSSDRRREMLLKRSSEVYSSSYNSHIKQFLIDQTKLLKDSELYEKYSVYLQEH